MYNPVKDFYNGVATQSLRFNDADPTYLERTPSSEGNRNTWTISFWVKRAEVTQRNKLFGAGSTFGSNHNNSFYMWFENNDIIRIRNEAGGSAYTSLDTTRLFRDTSAWYHIVYIYDSTQSTATDRQKLYINGVRETAFSAQTNPSQNEASKVNATHVHYFGKTTSTTLNAYLAEINFIDGLAWDSSYFGQFKEGIWIPKKYTGNYGTNGFHLEFADSSVIGDDTSGNNNDFTASGFVASDVMPDSPENNFATFNNLHTVPATTFLEGNLRANVTNVHKSVYATQTMKTGTGKKKYYFEAHAITGSTNKFTIGLTDERNTQFQQSAGTNHIIAYSGHNSYLYGDAVGLYHDDIRKNGTITGTNVISQITGGDIMMIAFDAETGKVWFGKNGTWVNGSGTDSTTLDLNNHDTTVAIGNDRNYLFGVSAENSNWIANFGQDPTFAGTKSSSGNSDGTTGSFYYSPPSGFIALNTENMQDPVIDPNGASPQNPTDNFNTILYAGDGTTSNSVSVGFQPDFVWLKDRASNSTQPPQLLDVVRGKIGGAASFARLRTDNTNGGAVEATPGSDSGLLSLDANGFTVGNDGAYNHSSRNYMSFNWKAGGSPTSNSNGSITSSVSANIDAGFSIVSYTGAGGSSATVGHGLTAAPDYILLKARDAGEGWASQWNTPAMGPTKSTAINSTGSAATSSGEWNNTAPTNTVFTIGNQGRVNTLNKNYIAYCFHNVDGYCKVGQYRGNANTNGTFVYTGFRPAWVLMKNIIDTTHWVLWDSKRGPYNVITTSYYPSALGGDQTGTAQYVDFLSNGFKLKMTHNSFNGNNDIHVYLAIAEQPFKYANAR